MKSKTNFIDISLRYLILLLIAIPNAKIFYFLFTKLTIYPTFLILNLFTKATLQGNSIILPNTLIEIVSACVAGSAYFLLTILNLSTPNIKLKKRLTMLTLSYFIFLTLNIIRIVFLSFLLELNFSNFDTIHLIMWYFLSTIMVILIWFGEVKYFKIKSIPFYTDIKLLYKKSSFKNDI